MSMPPEIRNEIYKHILTVPINDQGTVEVTDEPEHPEQPTVLSILQTCRIVNDEAKGLFYHVNPIHLRRHSDCKGGLSIARHTTIFLLTLSPERLHCIRDITITSDWLSSFTITLKRLEGLKGLRVVTLQIGDASMFLTLNSGKFSREMPRLLDAAHGLSPSVTEMKVRIAGEDDALLNLFRGTPGESTWSMEPTLISAPADRSLENREGLI